MTSSEVCEILYKLTSDRTRALERGLRDRERIATAIATGTTPSGHRVDWLRDTADQLNDTLMVCSRKFNDRYPSDMISVQDLVDALATLSAAYQKYSKKS